MSENKISMGYSSPDRELSARDIKRKVNKLKKTKEKLDKNLSARRRHNLEFKAEKTLDQITTGLSGIRPIKTPFKLKHQKSSPLNHIGNGNKHPHDNKYPSGHPPRKKSRKGSVQWYIDQQNQKDKEKRNN